MSQTQTSRRRVVEPVRRKRTEAPQRRRTLGVKDEVVAVVDRLPKAGPYDRLIVTRVYDDGRVDLKSGERGDKRRWTRVDPSVLIDVQPI